MSVGDAKKAYSRCRNATYPRFAKGRIEIQTFSSRWDRFFEHLITYRDSETIATASIDCGLRELPAMIYRNVTYQGI